MELVGEVAQTCIPSVQKNPISVINNKIPYFVKHRHIYATPQNIRLDITSSALEERNCIRKLNKIRNKHLLHPLEFIHSWFYSTILPYNFFLIIVAPSIHFRYSSKQWE